MSYPPSDIAVDRSVVRELLFRHYPALADQEIRFVGEGWDNYTFRVGAQHAVRLPRRMAAVALLRNEQRWLPILAPALPVEVPLPLFCGSRSELFPAPWSLVKWLAGTTAESHSFASEDVTLLARTLRALHQLAPQEAPVNPYRGVPLVQRSDRFAELVRESPRSENQRARFRLIWARGCRAEPSRDRRWLHGDLHPGNVVIEGNRLAGIIDWGDVAAGDVATDLACAWLLLDHCDSRTELLECYGASVQVRARARAWALYLALVLSGSGDAGHESIGRRSVDQLLADPTP